METQIFNIQVAGLTDDQQLELKRKINELLKDYADKRIDMQIVTGRTF